MNERMNEWVDALRIKIRMGRIREERWTELNRRNWKGRKQGNRPRRIRKSEEEDW